MQAKETSPRGTGSNTTGKSPRMESGQRPQRFSIGSFEPQSTLLEVSTEMDNSVVARQHSPDITPKEDYVDKPHPIRPQPLEDEPDVLEHKPLPQTTLFSETTPPPRPPSPIIETTPPIVPHPPNSADNTSGSETSEFDFDISSSEREYSSDDDEADGMEEEPDHAPFLGKSVR